MKMVTTITYRLWWRRVLNHGEDAGEVTEYKIGAIYSKTGPNSPLGEPEWNATKLLEEQINAEGGINGVPVKNYFSR